MNDIITESKLDTSGTPQWESEGGSLTPHQATLPQGIEANNVTHYRVGKYSYTNLEDAMAEHRRQSEAE